MRRSLLVLLILVLGVTLAWGQSKVIYPTKSDVSPTLRDMARNAHGPREGQTDREIPNNFPAASNSGGGNGNDPGLQDSQGFGPAGVTVASFEGASNLDNAAVVGFRVAPPDPNMDIGNGQIIQTVNLVTEIFNTSGTTLLGPFATDAFWSGFGGPCELNNDGDPVVLYDEFAGRWVVSQFVFSTDQCVAVSTTSNALGSYFRFQFSTPGNDYPKMGVMNDAYYMTIRNFSGPFNMDAVALNRAKMIVGDGSAEIIINNLSALLGGIDGFLPSDMDGTGGPSTGGVIMGFQSNPQNRLAQFDMVPNFPGGTATLTGPNFLPVNAIDISTGSAPQPAPGGGLDVLAFFMMNRLAMRDMGSYDAMVANSTVDAGFNREGIRWYELRNPGGGWSVFQQGTYAPNDGLSRWMGSIAMNASGDIGLLYTATSSNSFPSIRYTGREAGDILGQMTTPEGIIIQGTGSQTGTTRWGDYSSLSVDPADGDTFWGTHEYVQVTGNFNWWTRIGAFTVGPDDITITVTPTGTTTFGGAGGQLDYRVDITNSGGSSQTVQYWNGIVLPIGEEIGPQPGHGPFTTTVGAGNTNTFNLSLEVPGAPPANTYTFLEHVGTFSAPILDTDGFTFTKTAAPGTTVEAGDLTMADFAAWRSYDRESGKQTGDTQAGADGVIPEDISLEQNYPNPFNPSTVIRYSLNQDTFVKVKVFNTLGQEVKSLVNSFQNAGSQSVKWDGTNAAGKTVSAGVYVYRLEAGDVVKVRKMTFTK